MKRTSDEAGLGLGDFAKRPPWALSDGMRSRAAAENEVLTRPVEVDEAMTNEYLPEGGGS